MGASPLAQWDIDTANLRIYDTDGFDQLAVVYDETPYPSGGGWAAVEVDWGAPDHYLRAIDYTSGDSEVITEVVLEDDDRYHGEGHLWGLRCDAPDEALYGDYGQIYRTI